MRILRVVELFSGVGAQRSALDRAGIPYESVAVCEIDRHAYDAYVRMHGPTPNLGDITKVEHLPACDLLFYTFPCTALSQAGRREGMQEGSGTASSLLWEVRRLLLDMQARGELPSDLVMENVRQVLSPQNRAEFMRWLDFLASLGYRSEHRVISAQVCDIPQKRLRCYCVSRLHGGVRWPVQQVRTRRLRSVLESDVDEHYYLSRDRLKKLIEHRARNEQAGRGFGAHLTSVDDDASTVLARAHREEETLILVYSWEQPGWFECCCRAYSADGDAPTVPTYAGGGHIPKIAEGQRIRRLTPRECWRLMDFTEQEIEGV